MALETVLGADLISYFLLSFRYLPNFPLCEIAKTRFNDRMSDAINFTDPQLSASDACRVTGIGAGDLDNWMKMTPLGVLVAQGRRTWRKFSALDLVRLRLMLALCGPTSPCTRSRSFLQPTIAYGISGMMLDQCIVFDAEGRLKGPGPVAAHRFLAVWCAGDDDNLTADVLHGGEVMERLGEIDNQLLIVDATRLVHETIAACCEITTEPQTAEGDD